MVICLCTYAVTGSDRLKRSPLVLRLMRGKHGDEELRPATHACPHQIVLLGIPRRRGLAQVSLPKIISAGSDDAIRIELARDGTYIVEFR
jgi:hypothetical protein